MTVDLRLRDPTPELLGLPWSQRLADWDPTQVTFRDLPVGPSRHLVRFVEADGRLWALKDLPRRVAVHEYDVLRVLEARDLSAVRAGGVVLQSDADAILVTAFLEGSWQHRRLLLRIPWNTTAHRARLFDAMAALLVELHRNGIYWGDCSLANTLFVRDGQRLQACLVDAETAEYHPALSDGQRQLDLDVMEDNLAGGLLDVVAVRKEPPEAIERVITEVGEMRGRYEYLWDLLHDEPIVARADAAGVGSRVRRLNEAGFAVDEVHLESAGGDDQSVRVKVAVAGRRFHAGRLRALTGLDVREGQATILVDDLLAHRDRMEASLGRAVSEEEAGWDWLVTVMRPGVERATAALGGTGEGTQAFCDLLEVRWLMSERAGHDVGDDAALEALATRATPDAAAANLAFVEEATTEMPVVDVGGGVGPT